MGRQPPDGSGKTGSEVLARVVRERREQLGMSRQDLADATGVPYPTIAQIETAYRGVSPSRLGVIARALGLDPAQLYVVLASDTATGEGTTTPRARRGARPSASAQTAEGSWHENPEYRPPAALAAPRADVAESPPSSYDVVDHVVALLNELPAGERLDALARVQRELLADLVQEEVRRATRRRRS